MTFELYNSLCQGRLKNGYSIFTKRINVFSNN